MLNDRDILALLKLRTENKNLDYKQGMNWATATAAEKARIVKDVLAMSNTKDGGKIAFGIRDQDFEPVGLSEEEFSSFDTTRFCDFVNRFADPPVQCGLYKFVTQGMRFVIIEVSEFSDVPVVCRADFNDSHHRQVLKNGATYIRTNRAASEIVSTAEIMRDLIDRSIVKRGDTFLRMVDRVIDSNPDKKELEDLKSAHKKALADLARDKDRSSDMVLEALGDALDLKNAESGSHTRRVTLFTIAIAQAVGLPRDEIAIIARGAFLHDIGKLAIPDTILRKPDKLTSEELALVQTHPYRGYEMIKKLPFLAGAAEIVYSHQERYDGTGYPRGLQGEEIPLGARIFAIADALEAITSPHPYRPARPLGVARMEIAHCSGTQFDPRLVDVFLGMPAAIWEDLRREIDEPTIN